MEGVCGDGGDASGDIGGSGDCPNAEDVDAAEDFNSPTDDCPEDASEAWEDCGCESRSTDSAADFSFSGKNCSLFLNTINHSSTPQVLVAAEIDDDS